MSAQDQSFYSDVIRYFDQAAAFTQHPSGLLDQIKRCNSVYRFEFPLSQPGGDVEVIQARRRYPGMQNLRTAAFFNSIEKVARTYLELVIFP